MKLSGRLELVVSFVRPAKQAADIGTDHGYVPAELVRRGIVDSALAMDVRKGPLLRAEETIKTAGLSDRIKTRLSDGLEGLLPGEAEAVVIAGMGGELMIHILESGKHMWDSVSQWVLSPQSELPAFRRWLLTNGFFTEREAMICDEGKYYTVFDVRRRREGDPEPDFGEKALAYGEFLIRAKDPVLLSYLEEEERRLFGLLSSLSAAAESSERAMERKRETEAALSMNREVWNEMQGNH